MCCVSSAKACVPRLIECVLSALLDAELGWHLHRQAMIAEIEI